MSLSGFFLLVYFPIELAARIHNVNNFRGFSRRSCPWEAWSFAVIYAPHNVYVNLERML